MHRQASTEDLENRIQRLEKALEASRHREAALREGEKQYRHLIENQTDLIIQFDTDHRILFVSPSYCRTFGRDRTQLLGESFFSLIHEKDHVRVRRSLEKVLEPPYETGHEERAMTARGWRWLAWKVAAVRSPQGRVTSFIGVGQDVTEEKEAREALQQSEERFRLAFHTSPDSININRLEDGVYIDINEGFTQIMGYRREDVIGRSSIDLTIWKEPKDRQRLVDGLRQSGIVENLEAQFQAKDGTTRTGLMSARILEINGESVILSITRDISQRREAENRLRQRSALEQLAATISADLAGKSGAGIDAALNRALATLGALNSADRAYLFQFRDGGKKMDNTHEWCADGIEPQKERLQDISMDEDLPWFSRQIHEQDMFHVSDVAALPPQAWREREHFEQQNIQSLIVIPMSTAGALKGFFGFDAVRQPKTWSEEFQAILKILGETFCHVIERNEKDRALRESETKFRLLVENTRDIIYALDFQGRFVYVSPSVQNLMGYRAQEVMGRPFAEFIHPDHLAYLSERFAGVLKGKELASDYRIVDKTGRTRWVHSATSPIFEEGRVVRLQGVLHDITDRVIAEEALRESEEKYRALVENANDAIFIAQDDRIKFPNPKVGQLTGYGETELETVRFADLIHPGDRDMVLERHKRRLAGEDPVSSYDFKILHKSGAVRTVRIHAVRVTWEDRPATLNFLRDITEQVELEARLIQSQKMESIGTLAGGVAHDFNNILFPIIGLSELLLEDLPPQGQEYDNAQEILKSAKRGRDLVKQILAFSRQSEKQMMPIRWQKVLQDALKLGRSTIPANIEITQQIQQDCGPVLADATQLHQIIMNLMTNAYQAVEPSSGRIDVSLRETTIGGQTFAGCPREPGAHAVLTVSDTGPGIDPVIASRIFEPYFTTKDQGKGTGLGLAVVYGIVKKLGGDIGVTGGPGKGTTFTVLLPVMKGSDQGPTVSPVKGRETGSERILLVDDEPAVVRMVVQMLQRLGYHVTHHTRSTTALEAFRTDPNAFDLVMTDMTMPEITGDRLAEEIRSVRPQTPVIICTGYSERMSRAEAEALGIHDILMKPIGINDMARTVRAALDRAKGQAQKPL